MFNWLKRILGTSQGERKQYVVGLTGGIASGKTQVSNCLAELGATIVDTDTIARDVVAPGMPALTEIREHFGADVLLPGGELNRAWLRERVFADAGQRKALEAITHPRIRDEALSQAVRATGPYVVLVVPLLIESTLRSAVDRILVVDTTPENQLSRLLDRDGSSEATAKAIIAAQTDRSTRLEAADDVISNNASLAELRNAAIKLHEQYLEFAQRKRRS